MLKPLKPVKNLGLIRGRILRAAKTDPVAPMVGRGNERHELTFYGVVPQLSPHQPPRIFVRLLQLAPRHCATVTSREPINKFGRIGFAPHYYVSPELKNVLDANAGDFLKLEAALRLIIDFPL